MAHMAHMAHIAPIYYCSFHFLFHSSLLQPQYPTVARHVEAKGRLDKLTLPPSSLLGQGLQGAGFVGLTG